SELARSVSAASPCCHGGQGGSARALDDPSSVTSATTRARRGVAEGRDMPGDGRQRHDGPSRDGVGGGPALLDPARGAPTRTRMSQRAVDRDGGGAASDPVGGDDGRFLERWVAPPGSKLASLSVKMGLPALVSSDSPASFGPYELVEQ